MTAGHDYNITYLYAKCLNCFNQIFTTAVSTQIDKFKTTLL